MNSKNLIVSGAVLAVLVAIIVVANIMSNRSPSDQAQKLVPGLTASTISAFQVTEGEVSAKLRKKGDVWVVSSPKKGAEAATTTPDSNGAVLGQASSQGGSSKEYPVDSASIASALEKLVSTKNEVLVSENAQKQATFEVDSAKGMLVEVWDSGNKLVGNFRIGKNGPDWNSNYVRSVGSNKVHLVSGSVKYAFFSDPKRWRDKSITTFDKASVKRLSIAKQGFSIVLEKSVDTAGVSTWAMTAPQQAKAKPEEVSKIIDALSALKCEEWEEDSAETALGLGFDKPEAVLTATLVNGDEKVLTVGRKKEGTSRFWVRTKGKPETFLIADFQVTAFDKKPEDFAMTETPAAAPVPKPAPAKPAKK